MWSSLIFFTLHFGQPALAADESLTFEKARMRVNYARDNVLRVEKEYAQISRDEIIAMQKLERAKKSFDEAKLQHTKVKGIREKKKTELNEAKDVLNQSREQFKEIRKKNKETAN